MADRKPMAEINVVPYIDVMLVLLVIFMATAPVLIQGIDVDLPNVDSEPLPETPSDPVVVSVNADGSMFLRLGADEEDIRVTLFSLAEQISKIIAARPNVPMFIRADEGLPYGEVIKVMNAMQRSGAVSVGLITDAVELTES